MLIQIEYTRYVKAYPLKSKDGTFNVIETYFNEVRNLFENKVKICTCDNGLGEYILIKV